MSPDDKSWSSAIHNKKSQQIAYAQINKHDTVYHAFHSEKGKQTEEVNIIQTASPVSYILF